MNEIQIFETLSEPINEKFKRNNFKKKRNN